jgi:hypothetical protein
MKTSPRKTTIMMGTRFGKIGRLPKSTRDALGQCSVDGKRTAKLFHRTKFDLPLDDLIEQTAPEKSDPATARPDPVRPLRVKPGKTR